MKQIVALNREGVGSYAMWTLGVVASFGALAFFFLAQESMRGMNVALSIPTSSEQGIVGASKNTESSLQAAPASLEEKKVEEKNVSPEPESSGHSPATLSENVASSRKVSSVLHTVPFVSQAPFGEWDIPEFQDGCEETSVLMAAAWRRGTGLSREEAKREILAMSQFLGKQFGHAVDTSGVDTNALLFHEYLNMPDTDLVIDFTKESLQLALQEGVVVIPMDGRALGNPNYTFPGPIHHMLVVIGYDAKTKEFITNDPGTRNGAGYRYQEDVFFRAARDYPTGEHIIPEIQQKVFILVRKEKK
jgi:hypothetical protein